MRHAADEILAFARNPIGRQRLLASARGRLGPALRLAAAAHRRTLARNVRVVAVTGSFGKTSTAAAVAAALGLPVTPRLASNNMWGLPAALLGVGARQAHAVIEVGVDRVGQMGRYSRMLRPDVAVVTGVGSEHQDRLGSLETTQREKARLMERMRRPGLAVLNGDDPRVRAMAAWTEARVVTYGLGPANDVRAGDVRLDWPHGTRFTLHGLGPPREVRLRTLGQTAVRPALAALAVATGLGQPLDAAVAALARLEPFPGRLQPVALPGGVWAIRDDTKASHETIGAALEVLAEIPGRRLLVLSRPPPWPESLEPLAREIGRRMAELLAGVVLVGDGAERLRDLALAAGMPGEALHPVEAGARAAVASLRGLLRPGDTVLVKGRLYQKLERVALALAGEAVACDLVHCGVLGLACADCAMRTRGWGDGRRILK
jgi:UDP-N-acetylmuramoyl-tripeptide--D-alanyl-D-alanine ligase